jgi:hypothetical protein
MKPEGGQLVIADLARPQDQNAQCSEVKMGKRRHYCCIDEHINRRLRLMKRPISIFYV